MAATTPDIDNMKASLLHRLRPTEPLGPDDGDEAFDRHVLLAIRIHRAARINQTVSGEGKGWVEFLTTYFPAGRNGIADANLLWKGWRVALLKDMTLARGVAVTHGQPDLHWQRDVHGALVIDLESMYADYEYAVDQFIAAFANDPEHAAVAIARWRDRSWTLRPVNMIRQMPLQAGSGFTGVIPVGSVSASDYPAN